MPSTDSMHVDAALSDYSRKYENGLYVAKLLFPPWSVKKLSDKYAMYDRTPQFSVLDTTMGPKGEAKMVEWSVTWGTYGCLPHGLKDPVTDQDRKNADAPIDPELDTVEFLKDHMLLDYEDKVAALATTLATYPASNRVTLAGADQWNSGLSGATPVQDINTGIAACAMAPNLMIIGYEAWLVLREDAGIVARTRGIAGGTVTEPLVAESFGLDRVVVAKARKSTAAGVLSYVWGKDVVLAHTTRPGPKSIQFGVCFSPTADEDVRVYRQEQIGGGADMIECNWSYDYKVIASDVAYLMKSVIS